MEDNGVEAKGCGGRVGVAQMIFVLFYLDAERIIYLNWRYNNELSIFIATHDKLLW